MADLERKKIPTIFWVFLVNVILAIIFLSHIERSPSFTKEVKISDDVLIDAQYSNSGRYLISANQSNVVSIWDLQLNKEIIKNLVKLTSYITLAKVAISDSKAIITEPFKVNIWDLETKLNSGFINVLGIPSAVDINNKNQLAVGYTSGVVDIYDLNTKDKINSILPQSKSSVTAIKFDVSGDLVAIGYNDKLVITWSVAENKLLRKFEDTASIQNTYIIDNNQKLVTSTNFGPVKIFDVNNGQLVEKLFTSDGIKSYMPWSLNQKILSFVFVGESVLLGGTTDSRVVRWDINTSAISDVYLIPRQQKFSTLPNNIFSLNYNTSTNVLSALCSDGISFSWIIN